MTVCSPLSGAIADFFRRPFQHRYIQSLTKALSASEIRARNTICSNKLLLPLVRAVSEYRSNRCSLYGIKNTSY